MSKLVLSLVLLAVFAICAAQNNQFGLGANVNNGQWNVNGQYQRNFNGGSLGVSGSYGSGNQWGVNGQYTRSWNGGNTNLGVNGGYSNGGGFNAGVRFTHRFDDVEESDAQFFKDWMKKAGRWLKEPENLQKVVDVYRTVRSDDDDDEEADFSLPSWVNWENAQKAIDLYQQIRRDEEDDDEEADSEFIKSVWKKIGPTVRELGKNYLRSKGIPLEDDEEESDQNNNFNFGANVNNGQWGVNGQYQRSWNGGNTNLGVQGQWQQGSGYNAGVNFSHRWDSEEDDDEESDLRLPSWVNWENAQKAFQIYQQFRRDQDDEADEESDAEFIKSVWKKVAPVAKELGKNYLRSKGIPLEDDEDALADEVSSWQGQSAANWAWSQIGKGYSQSARYGPNSFDCSGLVNRAYASVGVNVPSTTGGYPGGMRRVSEGEMRAGDILYKPGHVAMYAGNGQVVHAANSRLGVVSIPFNNFKSWWGFNAIYRP